MRYLRLADGQLPGTAPPVLRGGTDDLDYSTRRHLTTPSKVGIVPITLVSIVALAGSGNDILRREVEHEPGVHLADDPGEAGLVCDVTGEYLEATGQVPKVRAVTLTNPATWYP
jgi:hypothetical protein